MLAFWELLAHESQRFRGPNSVKKKEIIQNIQEKSWIFQISVATIFVTIGFGKVKKSIENRLNSTFFVLFRKTYKKNIFSVWDTFSVEIYRFGKPLQALMSQNWILCLFHKFYMFTGDFGQFPFFSTKLRPRKVGDSC